MNDARAVQTLGQITHALQSGGAAALPELLKVIQTMAQDESVVSVTELAELIKRDEAVLTKVITAANSLGYNPSGVKIATVFEAIHVLGFNCVRRLALSLVLMEHAGRQSTPSDQREMAAISVCSGMIAQVAAEQMTLVDPEKAFMCAALRNFGALVLGSVMGEQFHEARQRAQETGNDDAAYRETFGLTPLELGFELLKSSALPQPILVAIRSQPPLDLETLAWAERRMAHLAAFALKLSELALDPAHDASAFGVASVELMQRFTRELPALPDVFPDLLERAAASLGKIARSAGGDSLDQYGFERLRHRVDGHDLPTRPSARLQSRRSASAVEAPPVETIEEACAIVQREGHKRDAIRIALEALHAQLDLSDAFCCTADTSSGEFRLHHGYGALAETLRGKTLFRRHERNVFLLCHARLETVIVRDADDAGLQPHLPIWLRQPPAPKSFILLPVHHAGRSNSVFVIGWPKAQGAHLAPDRLALIRKLLDLVARATSIV